MSRAWTLKNCAKNCRAQKSILLGGSFSLFSSLSQSFLRWSTGEEKDLHSTKERLNSERKKDHRIVKGEKFSMSLPIFNILTNRPPVPHSRVGWSLWSFQKKFIKIFFCDWPKQTYVAMWHTRSMSRFLILCSLTSSFEWGIEREKTHKKWKCLNFWSNFRFGSYKQFWLYNCKYLKILFHGERPFGFITGSTSGDCNLICSTRFAYFLSQRKFSTSTDLLRY